jgi:membrane-bound inhibitor of C-type lysozyme
MRILSFVSAACALVACERAQDTATVNIVTYQCGEREVSAVFRGSDSVEVSVAGRTLLLPHVESGSGAKYADDKGNELWTKGLEAAMLTLAGQARQSCSAPGKPGLVAIGQEPGWRVDVAPDEPPSMVATLEYGERKFDASNVVATASGWSGTAPDGTAVTLVYERAPCQDSMSGEPFEATATLTVGDRTYRGCARFGTN